MVFVLFQRCQYLPRIHISTNGKVSLMNFSVNTSLNILSYMTMLGFFLQLNLTEDSVVAVRVAYAENIAQLAETALR